MWFLVQVYRLDVLIQNGHLVVSISAESANVILRYRYFQMRPFNVIVQLNVAARLVLTVLVRACFRVVILSTLARTGGEVVSMLVGGWEGASTD